MRGKYLVHSGRSQESTQDYKLAVDRSQESAQDYKLAVDRIQGYEVYKLGFDEVCKLVGHIQLDYMLEGCLEEKKSTRANLGFHKM